MTSRGRRGVRAGRLLILLFLIAATAAVPAARAQPVPVQIVTGWDAGWPEVRAWDRFGAAATTVTPWGEFMIRFPPYPTWKDGVHVAVGDLDGDGRPEIVTAPGGEWGDVRVFDGRSFRQLAVFPPYKQASWWGGVYVAAGDTDRDGRAEVVAGLGPGCCTSVNVLHGLRGDADPAFFPFGRDSDAGARVAAADVNGDGAAEVLAAPSSGDAVSVFAAGGGEPIRTIDTFGAEAYGAVSFAAGDLLDNARAELVAASATTGGVTVKVVDLLTGTTVESLLPFPAGAYAPQVAIGDVDGDGRRDLVVSAQTPAGTQVRALDVDGRELSSFFTLEPDLVHGASLAAGDLDGDGKAEIVLGGGPSPTPAPPVSGPDQRVVVYRADGTRIAAFSAYPGVFQGGVRVGFGEVNGAAEREFVTAPGPGFSPQVGVFTVDYHSGLEHGTALSRFLAYEPEFRGGLDVAVGDVLGRGAAQIVTAPGAGRPATVRVFDVNGSQLASFTAFEDAYRGGVSIAAGDLNADGRAEIVVGTLAAPARVRAFSADGNPYGALVIPFADRGVEVAVADVAGTGYGLVAAGEATGDDPLLALLDPATGAVLRTVEPAPTLQTGLRLAAGDLDGDGRDEIVAASGWGGDNALRILDGALAQRQALFPYAGTGMGFNVAVPARIGLPIRADARTLKLVVKRRARVIVGRFVDAASTRRGPLRAAIDWGDGTSWRGLVVQRSGRVFDVRSTKRYARTGRYLVAVTLTDGAGRSSLAQSTVIVRRR